MRSVVCRFSAAGIVVAASNDEKITRPEASRTISLVPAGSTASSCTAQR